ncbi:MAG: glycosyl transferase family 2 [Planctomycetota bacterium]
MTEALLWVAYAAHWALTLAWSACHFQISDARRRMCGPAAQEQRPGRPRPSVTVVLPAKDEAADLKDAATAILSQRDVELQLVIVDDRSTDGTGEAAEQVARRDARCRVIHNRELPDGWMGKSHACWRGAAGAASEWLLFTDADVRLDRDAAAAAIARARLDGFDLFSLWPRDDSAGFWPRLLVPLCGAMIVIWYGRVAARSNRRGDAFANGQFLLIRRRVYEAVGGHAAVQACLIEDIPLARVVARSGGVVGSAPGPDLVGVRMYRTLAEVTRGWRRIFVGVLTPMQILGCIGSLMLGSVLPLVLLPIALAMVIFGGASTWATLWLCSAAAQLTVLTSVSIRFFGLAKCDRRRLWLYPLSVAGVLAILVGAWWDAVRGRMVEWRGTRYSVRSGKIETLPDHA